MKLIIGRDVRIPNSKIIKFPTNELYPQEIRDVIHDIINRDSFLRLNKKEEIYIETLNLTVLELIRPSGAKDFDPNLHIPYEDVLVLMPSDNKLVPLLNLHSEAWLSHFSISDLFNRGEI